MKVRWSIVILAVLGVVAALAAAVLTASLSAQQIQAAIPSRSDEVTILIAAKNVPAMTPLSGEMFAEKIVKKRNAPEGYYSDAAQVIGKIISIPMLEGQTFTKGSFPSDSTGLLLAAQLPAGKRAVTVSLSDSSGLEGILYPGCRVDVLAFFKFSSNVKMGEAISTTLLQNIQVLGVEDLMVVSKSEGNEVKTRSNNGVSRKLRVTLLVDSKQAEALQLAMEKGEISLALRNPSDDTIVATDATLLSDGVLARLAELMGTSVKEVEKVVEEEAIQVAVAADESVASDVAIASAIASEGTNDVETASVSATPIEVHIEAPAQQVSNSWEVDVLRGLRSETASFNVRD